MKLVGRILHLLKKFHANGSPSLGKGGEGEEIQVFFIREMGSDNAQGPLLYIFNFVAQVYGNGGVPNWTCVF